MYPSLSYPPDELVPVEFGTLDSSVKATTASVRLWIYLWLYNIPTGFLASLQILKQCKKRQQWPECTLPRTHRTAASSKAMQLYPLFHMVLLAPSRPNSTTIPGTSAINAQTISLSEISEMTISPLSMFRLWCFVLTLLLVHCLFHCTCGTSIACCPILLMNFSKRISLLIFLGTELELHLPNHASTH